MRLLPLALKSGMAKTGTANNGVLALLVAGALSVGGIGAASADDAAQQPGAVTNPTGQDDQISASRPEPPKASGQPTEPGLSQGGVYEEDAKPDEPSDDVDPATDHKPAAKPDTPATSGTEKQGERPVAE